MHCNVAICPLLLREKSWVDHVFKCWAVEARQIEFSAAIWREGTFIKTHLHCGIREGAIGGICLAGNKACWAATIVGCYNCGALQLWGTATQYSSGALQLWGATNLWGATIGSASKQCQFGRCSVAPVWHRLLWKVSWEQVKCWFN